MALAALLTSCSYEAVPHARVENGRHHARVETGERLKAEDDDHARVGTGTDRARRAAGRPDPFGASCRSRIFGSQVVGYCFNPYADPDRVRLHIECARWWDIDSDSAPVEAGPAQTVRLTGRCWKEVRSVWFSHQRPED
jgi:hypothetical protein